MKVEVRYHSKSGNTQKVAEAIGQAVGSLAKPVDAPLSEPTDVLFLGGASYAGDMSKELRAFAQGIEPGMVKKVVVFSTAAGNRSIYPLLKQVISGRGVTVSGQFFHCNGKFLLAHRGRPNAEDLEKAAAFARKALE